MLRRLRSLADSVKREVNVYRLVLKDNRTPRVAKVVLSIAVGYALCPLDLIPDWIPVIGHLDDLVIVATLVAVALKFIPKDVIRDCRNKVQQEHRASDLQVSCPHRQTYRRGSQADEEQEPAGRQ